MTDVDRERAEQIRLPAITSSNEDSAIAIAKRSETASKFVFVAILEYWFNFRGSFRRHHRTGKEMWLLKWVGEDKYERREEGSVV
jgi:hypothetical protein